MLSDSDKGTDMEKDMEDSRAHLKKYGKIIQVILIILRVFTIITIVIGGIMILVPIFQPDKVNDLKIGFEDSDFLIVQMVYGLTDGKLDVKYRFMISGAILALGMALMLYFLTKLQKLFRMITQQGTPFTREITDHMRRLSWLMIALIVFDVIVAIVAFLLMRFLVFIFEYGTYLQSRADETSRIQEEMILSFAEITENKSEQTGKHVRRVAEYTRILAEEMGMDKEEAKQLRLASTMHDIGKLLVPAEILEKPARLTEEEFQEIKKHPGYGGELLHDVEGDVMHMARTVALEHHERPDGKGYPEGKKEENISIEGKIVAVADVYDALTSRRSYKEAWDEKDAYAEIVKGKGTQFDTAVVEAFERAYPKINEARLSLQDA